MIEDSSIAEPDGPKATFDFEVSFGNNLNQVLFSEVSGLEPDQQTTDNSYEGDFSSSIKMPGISKFGRLTFKRGVFNMGHDFFKWYNEIKMNTIQRQEMTIKLLNKVGKPVMEWKAINAWPTKLSGMNLIKDNKVAVELIDVAYENLIISNRNGK